MFWNILIRDLRRKRVMNLILLAFIILATMFVSSSINNIATVTSALDNYLARAGIRDYTVATRVNSFGEDNLERVLKMNGNVEGYAVEPILYLSDSSFRRADERGSIGTVAVSPLERSAMTFFDADDAVIELIEMGTIYLPQKLQSEHDLEIGDVLTLRMGDVRVRLTVKGFCKDALFGSKFMGLSRCLLSEEDFDRLWSCPEAALFRGNVGSINTQSPSLVEKALFGSDIITIMLGDIELIRLCYVMDMVIAGILLVVSVCLLLIAFVVLRFTINFTLSEEYREIGVMKAIGIRNGRIRGLYLVKYLALSVIGALLGFAASIPFGDMLLESISNAMLIERKSSYIVNTAGILLVVGAVMLFCCGCTRRVNRFSPVDAVRSGATGERFRGKSAISLSRSRMRPVRFLALNDILSDFKRYAIMALSFTLCLLIIIILLNSINTLESDRLVPWFSMQSSDVYLLNTAETFDYMVEGGRDALRDDLRDMEQTLEENDMPGKCVMEMAFKLTMNHAGNTYKALVVQGTGTRAQDYAYTQGTPPRSAREIAITPYVAEKLDAGIGDTVTVNDMGVEREYLVTALFQSMNNMGDGVRVHEDAELSYSQSSGGLAYQITFDDRPDDEELARRFDRLRELYPEGEVFDGGGYVDDLIGVAGVLSTLKNVLITVVMIICMLVAVLMERSFIAKEKGEIATLKAVGFRDGAICRWHTLRMSLVLLISILTGVLISTPITHLAIEPVFKMIGAQNIEFEIVPLETFVYYPLLMAAVTLTAVALTSLSTRRIKASDTADIE